MAPSNRTPDRWQEPDFEAFEAEHPEGLTAQQIVAAVSARGEHLTEATFRKYVQLGLLPRSVRVGRKGKHRGSQGFYPATTLRQIVELRRLMAEGFTMTEIQEEFLAVRGELDALSRQLEKLFDVMARAQGDRADEMVSRSLGEARALADELTRKLEDVSRRLSLRARMRRAVI